MARRRRDDDDDDDDDFDDDRPVRRPAKEGGGGKTVLIILGIVGAVLLLIFGICGFFVYRAVTSVKSGIGDFGDTLKANAEADAFLSKLSSDPQTAYDSTSPAFRAAMTRDSFQQLLNRNPILTKSNTHRALSTNAPTGGTPNRKMVIVYEVTKFGEDFEPFPQPGVTKAPKPPPGPRTVTITLTVAEQPGGFWKVDGFTVP